MNKTRIEKERDRMIHMTEINTHPKILNACFFSSKLQFLFEELFFHNVLYGRTDRGIGIILFYLKRVEKLSDKNIALKIIENEFHSFKHNSKMSEKEFKKKIKEVMKHLRESLK